MVESYLKEYIGVCTEIFDTNEMIYIGSDFPDEYSHSKDTNHVKLYQKLCARVNSGFNVFMDKKVEF